MPIETFYNHFKVPNNKQQAGIKSICTEERGKRLCQLKYLFKFRWFQEVFYLEVRFLGGEQSAAILLSKPNYSRILKHFLGIIVGPRDYSYIAI